MDLTDEAIKNLEELWPNRQSKAEEMDPEFTELFANFAFDEVINHDAMDSKIRVIVILASTLGSQALGEYKVMVDGALNMGVSPVEIKEILYQAVPYVGFSKVTDFVNATNKIFTERGIELPLEEQSTTTRETRHDKGLSVQKEIFGDVIDSLYENSPEDLLHIQHYLSANCFGDYYTRNGLDIKTRELITLSFLIAMGGTESQIKGHIRGNTNVGNDRQMLINLITQLLPYVGYPRTLNALSCLNEVSPEE
ncbi:MAG TPA: carboxymuconolactone decarboxylase family protein [Balneolaceae bacterium]|nr:carboxymuconolactone decarboxylase family protein [Balneolaceae bacterium]